jgi:hypothetical protein
VHAIAHVHRCGCSTLLHVIVLPQISAYVANITWCHACVWGGVLLEGWASFCVTVLHLYVCCMQALFWEYCGWRIGSSARGPWPAVKVQLVERQQQQLCRPAPAAAYGCHLHGLHLVFCLAASNIRVAAMCRNCSGDLAGTALSERGHGLLGRVQQMRG